MILKILSTQIDLCIKHRARFFGALFVSFCILLMLQITTIQIRDVFGIEVFYYDYLANLYFLPLSTIMIILIVHTLILVNVFVKINSHFFVATVYMIGASMIVIFPIVYVTPFINTSQGFSLLFICVPFIIIGVACNLKALEHFQLYKKAIDNNLNIKF